MIITRFVFSAVWDAEYRYMTITHFNWPTLFKGHLAKI